MFVDLGHDTHLPQTCLGLGFPSRSRCVTAPSCQAISGTTSYSRFSRESPKKSRCLVSRVPSLGCLFQGDDSERSLSPLSPQVFGVPACTERRSERNRGGRSGTARSLLLRWTQGVCPRGVVLEEAAGRNRGAVLRRLRRHIELMDEPQAEVLEEGWAARATAPECARRRLSRRQGARGCPVVCSRSSPTCSQTRVHSVTEPGAQPRAQSGVNCE
jgi:hypothetical protein